MSNIREGLVFAYGNPLLDICCTVDKAFLDKYSLKENDQILADEARWPMFKEMEDKFACDYIAGGATLNSVKICQWILGKPHACIFVGCIGNDEYGKTLEVRAAAVGMKLAFKYHETQPTGTCATCILGHNRSLVANLAAADHFTVDHLEVPANKALYENAGYYYMAGFPLTACPDAVMLVASHAAANNKPFLFNLSAPFLSTFFKDRQLKVLPFVDVLFGNETEAREFASVNNLGTDSPRDIAVKLSHWEKTNKQRQRIVVITQGCDPTIVAIGDDVKEYPVLKLADEKIVDTNGAGDAFVGGFLSQFVQQKPTEECVRCGSWAASVIIQRSGCTFPEKCEFA